MQCHNHPNARAIDQCTSCNTGLCGMCATYKEDAVLCEKCAENYDSRTYVDRQKEALERPEDKLQYIDEEAERAQKARRNKFNPVVLQVSVIIACAMILVARLVFFNGPVSAVDVPQSVQDQRMTSLAQCLIVFRQIGVSLAETGTAPELSCPDNFGANTVRRVDNDIIVSHPQPGFYGFSRIEVSRLDPEPRLIE